MTTPEPESIDETMRGMGDPADYDGWAEEAPDHEQRLTELVMQLADLGLHVTTEPAPRMPRATSATAHVTCGHCGLLLIHAAAAPEMTSQMGQSHLCDGNPVALVLTVTGGHS